MDEDEIAHLPPQPADTDETTPARKPILQALAVLITLVIPAFLLFLTITNSNSAAAPPADPIAALLPNPGFENGLTGWYAGITHVDSVEPNVDYIVNIDHSVAYSSTASAHIAPGGLASASPPAGGVYISADDIGYLSTKIPADYFRGKRVRYSAYLRTDNVAQAGLYMRVPGTIDGKPTDPDIPLSWDDMTRDRAVQGTTDWRQYSIVLDIPPEADFLIFGVATFSGQLWIDDVQLEIVDTTVASTDKAGIKQLTNLDFEQGLDPWRKDIDSSNGKTDVGTGAEMAHSGKLGAYVQHTGAGFAGGLSYAYIYGGYYRDKKVRASAYMNVDKAPTGGALGLFALPLSDGGERMAPVVISTTVQPALSGKGGWQHVAVTLDVPDRTYGMGIVASLVGDGELWIDDVHLDILGPASTPTPTPTPGISHLSLPHLADFLGLPPELRPIFPPQRQLIAKAFTPPAAHQEGSTPQLPSHPQPRSTLTARDGKQTRS